LKYGLSYLTVPVAGTELLNLGLRVRCSVTGPWWWLKYLERFTAFNALKNIPL